MSNRPAANGIVLPTRYAPELNPDELGELYEAHRDAKTSAHPGQCLQDCIEADLLVIPNNPAPSAPSSKLRMGLYY